MALDGTLSPASDRANATSFTLKPSRKQPWCWLSPQPNASKKGPLHLARKLKCAPSTCMTRINWCIHMIHKMGNRLDAPACSSCCPAAAILLHPRRLEIPVTPSSTQIISRYQHLIQFEMDTSHSSRLALAFHAPRLFDQSTLYFPKKQSAPLARPSNIT